MATLSCLELFLCRGPLSLGDAYLQHQNAAYQASLGWQDPDFMFQGMLGKLPFSLPHLAEVVWPGAQVTPML